MDTGLAYTVKHIRKGLTLLKKPVILFFRGSLCEMSRRELAGIMRYAHEAKWNVQTVEFAAAAGSRFSNDDFIEVDVPQLLAFWKPVGCIVECSGQGSRIDRSLFGKTPVVFLDSYPDLMGENSLCVSSDSESISALAARELLSLGFGDYAYVPWPEDRMWSEARCRFFKRHVKVNGRRFHLFTGHGKASDVIAFGRELSHWISQLPKPCGVFAANDIIAERVLSICASSGIDVPGDVAVIGVDDDEQVCENAVITLSSIRPDSEASGHAAAALLDRRINHPRAKLKSVVCGSPILRKRLSTRHCPHGDSRAIRAVEYIRLHGCEGISRRDVISVMGCSPRLADIRFHETHGHSILDEIHLVRLEHAKTLLRNNNYARGDLSSKCGYHSADDFRRAFKRYEGMAVGAWLKKESLL